MLLTAAQLLVAAAPASAQTSASASATIPAIARLHYDGGGDWYANPSSLPNLLREISERTHLRISLRPGEVKLTDPDLGDYPYLYVTGHGNISLSDEELFRLREYLTAGGFVHVDDNYGLDESFRREIRRLFEDRELVEVPGDHAIYNIMYELPDGLPKIHEHDGKPAQGFGIFVDGRLALYYSYESDLGDGWEDASVHGDPEVTRELAIRMGVNLFLYALASTPAG
ncbi:MAG: DUF4159 domain-containing protein [Gemmatimonadota bacterium]|nr:DUF4159 domain-containing protein [Gemmatimonadota bacterium]